jgi:TolB-like protein
MGGMGSNAALATADSDYPRRLAAVLCADVSGYSRLMAADEEATVRTVRASLDLFRREIAGYSGRVVDTAGDGVLAEFSSAVNAVNFAIRIQRALRQQNADLPADRRAEFRIGISLGDVIVQEQTIYGDTVNIAARLEEICPTNGVCVTGAVHEQVKNRVTIGYECLGERPLKNIPEPVEVWRLRLDEDAAILAPSFRRQAQAPALPSRPSIAVLPFQNLNRDPEQDYFADGLTEDIITGLSKFRELFVIARSSSFVFKGRQVSVQEAGRELGVRYLLEGSVRTAGQRVRVTAQLIEAATGRHAWAENYDRELTDIFAVQDDIKRLILATLVGQLHEVERQKFAQANPDSLEAYGLFLKGQEALFQFSKEGNESAQRLYRQAIDKDPGYSRAYAALSRTYHYDWQFSWSSESERSLGVAYDLAKKAVALDELNAHAYAELGFVHLFQNRPDLAVRDLERARSLNPNDPDILAELSNVYAYSQPARSRDLMHQAMRLNPHHPDWYLWYLADALYALREYENVIAAIEQMYNPAPGRRLLAASYGQLGRLEEARVQAAEVLRLQPEFSINAWVAKLPESNPEELEHFKDGLRKAGLPE